MEILVRGSNVTVAPAVEADSRRKASKLGRLATDIRRVEIRFSELRNPRIAEQQQCEVTVQLTRHLVKATATATDARSALDRAVERATQQLARVHDKRVDRTRPRHPSGAPPARPGG
jgi:ribosomal subunit interface protein